ncbi:hypothetical protein U1Q18_004997 [Sarracenia purpurea var. burkii]
MVGKFYANWVDFDFNSHSFRTVVRGNFGPVEYVVNWELTNGSHCYPSTLTRSHLCNVYRALNEIVSSVIAPIRHDFVISPSRSTLLYALGQGYSYDLADQIWRQITLYINAPSRNDGIPFFSLITRKLRVSSRLGQGGKKSRGRGGEGEATGGATISGVAASQSRRERETGEEEERNTEAPKSILIFQRRPREEGKRRRGSFRPSSSAPSPA